MSFASVIEAATQIPDAVFLLSFYPAATETPELTIEGAGLLYSGERAGEGVELESSVLWPAVAGLYNLRVAIPVTARGQLLAGIQGTFPEDREDEGDFTAYAVSLGWRQYVWRGLHIDGSVLPGWGRLRDNVFDGEDYDSFDVELMGHLGWRFDLGSFYALVQPLGVIGVVYKSNPWRIRDREGRPRTEGPTYAGIVLLGFQF